MGLSPEDEKAMNEWLRAAVDRNVEPMRQSAMFVSIATKNFIKDPLCALQLGMAILMDKPIVIIADKNEKMPEALVKIAKVIEKVDFDNKADFERAMTSVGEFAQTLPEHPA